MLENLNSLVVALIAGPIVALIGLAGTWLTAAYRRNTESKKTTVAILREQLKEEAAKKQALAQMLVECLSETGEIGDGALAMLRTQFDLPEKEDESE